MYTKKSVNDEKSFASYGAALSVGTCTCWHWVMYRTAAQAVQAVRPEVQSLAAVPRTMEEALESLRYCTYFRTRMVKDKLEMTKG